jgi:High potential iron-sulfur protein
MHKNQPTGISRRSLVKCSICALTSIAIVSLASTKAVAADKKLAKSAVQYEDRAKQEGKDCDDCIQFLPGKTATAVGTCKIVEGDINPHGHCIAFTPKPKR